MDLQLEGKRALVTGSTAGIGFGAACQLAAEGAKVVLNGRTATRVDEAVERCRKQTGAGDLVSGIAADLATAEGAARLFDQLPEVDILVNNLGIFEPKPFLEIPDGDWLKFFEVNVLSGVRASRHYLPGMMQRKWGRIIFVSSESALNTPAEMIHYGMTKTAQLAVSRGLAETATGTGVTVNAVLPGPTESEGLVDYIRKLAQERGVDEKTMGREFIKMARPTSLLGRPGTVAEVADLIVFLCSPRAAAITGDAVRVDGGIVRHIG